MNHQNWNEVLRFAASKGRTARDVQDFEHMGQAMYYHDLSLDELYDEIKSGKFKALTLGDVREFVNDKTPEEVEEYKQYLQDYWNRK
jgi:hypothetical protein